MTEMPEVPAPDIARHIAKRLGDDTLTVDDITAVIAAWNDVRGGDPVGMIRRNAETGEVAHRVDADGVHQWRISHPDGDQFNDVQPTLSWPVIYEPET